MENIPNSSASLLTPVGVITVTAVEGKINAILFDGTMEAEPPAALSPELAICLQQLRAYFRGELRAFDFPMTQEGTPFQQCVWEELRQIPFGKTITYLELSRRLGNEKAIRAVGLANGRNRLSIAVPCHRVIGSDGSLTGYGGGLWRKQWLLEHESKFASGVQRLF